MLLQVARDGRAHQRQPDTLVMWPLTEAAQLLPQEAAGDAVEAGARLTGAGAREQQEPQRWKGVLGQEPQRLTLQRLHPVARMLDGTPLQHRRRETEPEVVVQVPPARENVAAAEVVLLSVEERQLQLLRELLHREPLKLAERAVQPRRLPLLRDAEDAEEREKPH